MKIIQTYFNPSDSVKKSRMINALINSNIGKFDSLKLNSNY